MTLFLIISVVLPAFHDAPGAPGSVPGFSPGEIIFNELLFKSTFTNPEFVELYNSSSRIMDLSGWTFGDPTRSRTIPEQTFLNSGSYLVITGDRNFAESLENAIFITGFPSLNNRGDQLFLSNRDGILVDSIAYSEDWGDDGLVVEEGVSLERKDPLAASNDPGNWHINLSETGHTAGKRNTAYSPDLEPPTLIFAGRLPGNRIVARFDEFINPGFNARFQVQNQVLTIDAYDPYRGDEVLLRVPASLSEPGNKGITLAARNIRDVKGNPAPALHLPIAEIPVPGELAINEIMYRPITDPNDFQPDQSEYVEIINTKEHAISLEGLFLRGTLNEHGNFKRLEPVKTRSKWVEGGHTALFYPEEHPGFAESRIYRAFKPAGEEIEPRRLLRVETRSLVLDSESDVVILSGSTDIPLDSVYYRDEWHNPNIIDTRGIALERVHPAGDSNSESNWGSSASPEGGTPLRENTLFREPDTSRPGKLLTLSPNPFSPDGDGFEDHLLIHYRLEATDYLLHVRIYDRFGRLIRTIADGSPAGRTGTLTWDGLKDNRTQNRIGLYIIIFEAYNSTTGKNQVAKKVAVLAGKI